MLIALCGFLVVVGLVWLYLRRVEDDDRFTF
jgi:nitrate reductase gamma subunit